MIGDDFDIALTSLRPYETNASLVVDANAHLAFPIAVQRFRPVSSRNAQVAETPSLIEQTQLSQRDRLNIGRKPTAAAPDQITSA
jgi:hypothetical protein